MLWTFPHPLRKVTHNAFSANSASALISFVLFCVFFDANVDSDLLSVSLGAAFQTNWAMFRNFHYHHCEGILSS
jgi:hypothetical protein